MQDMAHFMHGSGDVAGAFRADAARLFGSIDALEGRKGQMPLAEFRDTATRLRADLEALRGRIGGAIHPNADPGGGPVLIPDRTLFAPAEAMGSPVPPSGWTPLPPPIPERGSNPPCARSCRPVDQSLFPSASALPAGLARRLATARPLQRQGQRDHDPPRCRGALARAAGPRNGRRRAHPADPGDSPGLRHAPDHDGNRGAPYHRRKGNRRLLSAFLRRTHPARHGGPVAPERGAKRLRARAVRDEKARGPDRKHAPAHARWDPRFRVSGGRPGCLRSTGANPQARGEYIRPRWITMWT